MQCIDAAQSGDITHTGKIWTYQGLTARSPRFPSLAASFTSRDVAGRLHCVDAESGKRCWVHAADGPVWGSTLVADGKVFMPTAKGLAILAAGKQEQVLGQVKLGSPLYSSPAAANGTLYVVTQTGWMWAVGKPSLRP